MYNLQTKQQGCNLVFSPNSPYICTCTVFQSPKNLIWKDAFKQATNFTPVQTSPSIKIFYVRTIPKKKEAKKLMSTNPPTCIKFEKAIFPIESEQLLSLAYRAIKTQETNLKYTDHN